MKKLVINMLILSIILFITAWATERFDNIDGKHNTNPNIIRTVAANQFDSLDILFIGSSGTYSGINPAYFDSMGLRTYNLGVAGAGPYFYELLINDYLRSATRKPKSIFILVLPYTFTSMSEIDNFTSYGIHRYLHYPLSNNDIVRKYSLWSSYPSLLLKSCQKGVRNLLSTTNTPSAMEQQTLADKGFYRSDEITSARKESLDITGNKFILQKFNTSKFNYMKTYIGSLERQGVEVVLYSLPTNKLSSYINNDCLRDYQSAVSGLAKKYIFLDLLPQHLDSLCYRDAYHLNTYGASIVTSKLIAGIKANQRLRNLYGLQEPKN